jgi:hypothetical protein
MNLLTETIASIQPLRQAGSLVTSRLKRWSVDVAVGGFHHSGNTWHGALLRQAILDRFEIHDVPLKRLFVSDLGPVPLTFLRLPRGIPLVYHSHFMRMTGREDLWGIAESLAPFADKPMIVIIRLCKDVMVSNYVKEVRTFRRTDVPLDIEEFVLGMRFGVRKFVGYYNLIAESRRRGAAPTIVTTYAALLRDPVGMLERDAAFIGAGGLDRATLARIVEKFSFVNMQRMERAAATAKESVLPGVHRVEGQLPDAPFVRKGGIGQWRETLAPRVAAEIDAYVAAHLDPLFRAAALGEDAAAAG